MTDLEELLRDIKAIPDNANSIMVINLSPQELDDRDIIRGKLVKPVYTVSEIIQVLQLLAQMPFKAALNLSYLSLDGNALQLLGPVIAITPLHSLQLSNNPLKQEGAKALGKAILHHPTLMHLVLDHCQIESGIEFIAKSLKTNQINALSLRSNKMRQNTMHLSHALNEQNALTALDISDNGIGQDGEAVTPLLKLIEAEQCKLQRLVVSDDICEWHANSLLRSVQNNYSLHQLCIHSKDGKLSYATQYALGRIARSATLRAYHRDIIYAQRHLREDLYGIMSTCSFLPKPVVNLICDYFEIDEKDRKELKTMTDDYLKNYVKSNNTSLNEQLALVRESLHNQNRVEINNALVEGYEYTHPRTAGTAMLPFKFKRLNKEDNNTLLQKELCKQIEADLELEILAQGTEAQGKRSKGLDNCVIC